VNFALAPPFRNVFFSLWLVIIGVSVHDGYLVFLHRSTISIFEQNPVGRLLLAWNGGDIWLLLAAKAIGTICASSVLLQLYWARPRLGGIACGITALLQLLLLHYLYLY
jgi:hypothetical protein